MEAIEKNLLGLKRVESEAILELIRRLNQQHPNQVEDILLYGSKARGDSEPDSDIDLLVLMKSDDRAVRQIIMRLAARVSLEYDVILSLLVMSEEHWQEREGLSLHLNVLGNSRKLVQ